MISLIQSLTFITKGEICIPREKLRWGVGFATGRKRFQKVLKTYVYNWKESGLTELENVELSLFVAYDLKVL